MRELKSMTTKSNNRSYRAEKTRLDGIVKKLPLLRFLDQSKAVLLSLDPHWQTWRKKHLPNIDESSSHLSALTDSTLTIHTNNASTAALIKSQLSSLLKALNQSSKVPIKSIKVLIDLETTSAALRTRNQFDKMLEITEPKKKPDQSAIDSIHSLKNSVKNPELSETLNNLAETLKNLPD